MTKLTAENKIIDENEPTSKEVNFYKNIENENQTNQLNDNDKFCDKSINNFNNNISNHKTIITNNDKTSTLPKKSVSFNSSELDINKFIDGEIIVDKQNPFKNSTSTDSFDIKFIESKTDDGRTKKIIKIPSRNVNTDEEFITTAEVLRQSKCVKTYIKNPDPYFKIDKKEIQRILSEDETDHIVREPIIKKTNLTKPLIKTQKPNVRTRFFETKPNSNNLSNGFSKKVIEPPRLVKQPRPKIQNGIKYPELSDLKIKTGTDQEKSLYNPIEVALNVRKFDDFSKKVHLGSQDDLDEIVDITDSATKNNEKIDENDTVPPSFTNTVTSEEFREYLKRNGLKLQTDLKIPVSAGNQTIENGILRDMDKTENPVKRRSVIGRLFSGGIFAKSSKTTPKEPILPAQSLYKKDTTDSKNPPSIKRVVLERQSYHGPPPSYQRPKPPTPIEQQQRSLRSPMNFSDVGNANTTSRIKPVRRSLRTDQTPNTSNIKQTYQEKEAPRPTALNIKRFEKSPQSSFSVSPEYPVYRSIDPNRIKSVQNSRLRQIGVKSPEPEFRVQQINEPCNNFSQIPPPRNERIAMPRPQQPIIQNEVPKPKKIKPPVPVRRTPERQSLIYQKHNIDNDKIYGNLNRVNSLNRNHRYNEDDVISQQNLQGVPAQVKISRTPIYNGNNQIVESPNKTYITPTNSNEQLLHSPIKTSTPLEEKQQQIVKNISLNEWNRLQELKSKQDEMLYGVKVVDPKNIYGKTKVELLQNENIYESTEKLRNVQIYQQPQLSEHFIRSPQRNTIGSIYRNRIHSQALPVRPSSPSPYINNPPRSQSVLDNMTDRRYLDNNSNYGTLMSNRSLALRRESCGSQTSILSKEEVLSKVRDFCRRSMNKTPTGSHDILSSNAKQDISPVSYASVEGKETPRTSQRLLGLNKESPIYVPTSKRYSLLSSNNSIIEENYRIPVVNRQTSETDSVFLPREHQPTPQLIKFIPVQENNNEIYGQIYPQEMRSLNGTLQSNKDNIGVYSVPTRQYNIIRPSSSLSTSNVRYTNDGRGTPLILYSIPRSPQKIVIRPNRTAIKPTYRAIVPNRAIPAYYQHSNNIQLKQNNLPYESESGSEAGEVQRIMQSRIYAMEEDWQNEKGNRNQQSEQATDDRRRAARNREDPRRHTLGGDMLHYGGQGPPQRTMDLEMGTRSQKSKKNLPVRGYTPVNQGPLFDDDPGIMSEVETASTGFRRGGKQRSSLPVVRTPSKTLERPLGLVFLQYRSETKRALLPNEITSIDTVRALFVRSFPRQLTMTYLEGPNVKIYIHDASKDMFYELEDVRSHLREIRDRSVLRLFESNEVVAPQALPGGPGIPQPLPPSGAGGHWDQDQSYFSEPEFDTEFQHQHIHKSKGGKGAPYYVGSAQTLPRGMYTDRNKNSIGAPTKPLRSYGSSMGPPFPYPDQLYSIPDGYMSSPERGTRGGYEEPYYSQYGTRGGAVTPIIDEEQSESSLAEDQYSLYGVKVTGRIPRGSNQLYDPTRPEDLHRMRIEHMERQLANLTGVVQKALTQNPIVTQVVNPNYLGVPGQCRSVPDEIDGHSSSSSTSIQVNGSDDLYIREKPPKLGKSTCHKSVSFEKSVSFSDDIQGVQKSHTPQHPADSKPPKPAIKSSTLPRTSSQERDRMKPPPPPKPLGLAPSHQNYRPDIALAPEVYNQLRGLQKKAKDLRTEVRTLRRLSQAQAVAVREDIKDTFMRIRATLLSSSGCYWGQGDQETITRLSREEELYKQEAVRLEKDLGDLENSVENLRTEVINRRTRVNMSSVEDMALVLSRASKTVAELKMKYPALESGLRNILNNEMEKIITEEKFMKDEPMRLESALRRCKKLTGTLVTLKRLASVQEQRLPSADPPPTEDIPRSADIQSTNKPIPSPRMGTGTIGGGAVAPENALDALLDELQTFAKPSSLTSGNNESRPDDSTSDDSSQTLQNNSTVTIQLSQSSLYHPNDPNAAAVGAAAGNAPSHHQTHGLRRLHSYPSGSDTDTSPPQPQRPTSGKPPVPERNADLLNKVNSNKRVPPPPPPRTSSRSPLASPTSPNMPIRLQSVSENQNLDLGNLNQNLDANNSSSSESVNSQDHVQRQIALELRHQELLKKQKQLQEQYVRLQQISKNNVSMHPNEMIQLKKTGSESNLPQKMGLNMSVSGNNSKNLRNSSSEINCNNFDNQNNDISNSDNSSSASTATSTTNKIYETDIL